MTNPSGSKTVLSSNPYLILNNQGEILPSFNLIGSYHTLGRDPQQVDLVVPPSWTVMSRFQACLRKVGNSYYIYDGDGTNPSANKLFINNTIITPTEGHQLQNGDEIKVGQNPQNWVIITYYDPSSAHLAKKPSQHSISLKNRSVLLGRDPTATLQLDAPTVSRRHATIDLDAQGRYVIHDYSTNGVFVNGQKVSGAAFLPPGATLRIVPYTFVLQGDDLVLVDQGENIRLDAEKLLRIVEDKKKRKITILNNISLPIEPGQFVALVGGSGAGKSTLLRTLLGIEPTTSGTVYLNGEDLRKNFNIYRTQIGYVPQFDIVHKDLTVGEVLFYAAKLRLPPDIDIEQVMEKTLKQVELSERRDTLVKDLSGGQLKRVSIGVELLADPKLFFLDEPTSGLDPGLDKKMMQLLAKLSKEGRTVILVTHATTNITLCDRLVFLGRGGNLCYFGTPQEAPQFFKVNKNDFADIYIQLESQESVIKEADRFRQSNSYQDYIEKRLSQVAPETSSNPDKVSHPFLQQLWILTSRYFKLLIRDRISLILSLLTAPIGISLITLAVRNQDPLIIPDTNEFELVSKAAPLALKVLFVFTSAALWVGLSSSLQEIVKESEIYKRERLVNLRLLSYLGSKILILCGLGLVQTLLISLVILIGFKSPNPELIPWAIGMSITTYLTLLASMSLGLMISAGVKNSTQANNALPILLLPQIIFSGVLFEIQGNLTKFISWLMISRWSIGAYGVLVKIKSMIDRAREINPNEDLMTLPFEDINNVYVENWKNLSLNWGILLLHSLIYLGVTYWLQKRKDIL
ncbi:FHA modulated ABC efflux pump with fused ATPase and integral membrane subunits [Gloeothece citriformis PCC 7424]|uniref:FHA modulated ABC efflux pump with fused ATPase and integral membrane subunits n=1 Tax=Gloeothece citriformis (strain PCC 7424) TaxID=65393 RepID=B7K9Y0_GLOC7|nr:ATP-binding cassette domain-containing protein [Gloeothece citriformis]ACK71336.1 FHA modulated ABC efflux pump with fused ATPase and integral membrane subunits [Gloeothece citriformis PCC 7424]